MFRRLKNWISGQSGKKETPQSPTRDNTGHQVAPPRAKVVKQKVPDTRTDFVEEDEGISGRIESNGPGKNVLIRNKYVREDTGTHETLKILDDSLVDSGEEAGIDPYNTGGFDRSKNWDKRFGK